MASGWMSTKPVLDRVNAAIDAHLVENVETSPLLSPFARMADEIPDAERAALLADARRAVAAHYQPVLRRFKAFVVETYRAKAPDAAGLAAYPGGARYYEYLLRSRIIRGTSAEEIHALGLAEVKRLRAEIGQIAKEVGFERTTDEFIEHMRAYPKVLLRLGGCRARRISRDAAARRSAVAQALPHRAANEVCGPGDDAGGRREQHGR